MRIVIESSTIPDDARQIATIAIAIYKDRKDGHRHIAMPFEISPMADKESVLLVHTIMNKAGEHFKECVRLAKKEYKEELETDELLNEVANDQRMYLDAKYQVGEKIREIEKLRALIKELADALHGMEEVLAKVRKSAWWMDARFDEIMAVNNVMTKADVVIAKAQEVANG